MKYTCDKNRRVVARVIVLALIITLLLPGTAFAVAKKPKKVKYATKIPVITYHRIVSDKAKKSAAYKKDKWTVSQSNFNKQMKWLHKKHYRTLSCEEFYLWKTGRIELPKRSVLITFDDGYSEAIERALPVLRQYNMKGTAFIIGVHQKEWHSPEMISMSRIRTIQSTYTQFEFQSHTYNLHYRNAVNCGYNTFVQDAAKQKEVFGFNYLAYPYGRWTDTMAHAYANSGIKMAFSFGDYGFATRKQGNYSVKRLAVLGNTSMKKFKKWCK